MYMMILYRVHDVNGNDHQVGGGSVYDVCSPSIYNPFYERERERENSANVCSIFSFFYCVISYSGGRGGS